VTAASGLRHSALSDLW